MTDDATSWPVLDRAHGALRRAVAGVPVDGWSRPTPCTTWTVAQVLQHAAGDQQGYAAVLGHGSFPSDDPFTPSGVLTAPPADLLEPTLAAAAAAFAQVGPDATEVAVPLPGGPFPAAVAVGACALDAAVHAWDIAVATDQPSPLDADLAAALMVVATQVVEPLRGFAYAAALPGDDIQPGALLRYLGRAA